MPIDRPTTQKNISTPVLSLEDKEDLISMKQTLKKEIKDLEKSREEVAKKLKGNENTPIACQYTSLISMYSKEILTREGVIYQIKVGETTKDQANRKVYPDAFKNNSKRDL